MLPRGRPMGDGNGWSMNVRLGPVGVALLPTPTPAEGWRCMLASLEREPASRHSSLGQREGESARPSPPTPTPKPVRPRRGTPGPALTGAGAMPNRPNRERSSSSWRWPCAIRADRSSSSPSADDDAVGGFERGVLGRAAAIEDERPWLPCPGMSPMAPCGDGAGDWLRADARTASMAYC